MPTSLRHFGTVVVFWAGICMAQESGSSAPDAPAEKESTAKFRASALEAASAFELRRGDGDQRKLARVADPVLRWSNPLGGQRARGEIFLWTDAGIPAAVVSINEFTDAAGRTHGEQEWCSLAAGPLAAKGPRRWSPKAGVLLAKALADVDPPADSAPQRQRQMRDLAARFNGEKTTRAGIQRLLRLLPKPIYRYEPEDAAILDGGLYVLAEGTDPEALLALEARRSGMSYTWHYAFARMNSVHLTGWFDGKTVWEAPALEGREVYDREDQAYTAFLRKTPE